MRLFFYVTSSIVFAFSMSRTLGGETQVLPSAATSDEIFCVARLELDELDPKALRAAAQAVIHSQWSSIAPMLLKYELMRRKLSGLGVRTVVQATATPEVAAFSDKDVVLFGIRGDERPDGVKLIEACFGAYEIDRWTAKQDANWITMYHRDQAPDFGGQPDEHSNRIHHALKMLGKRPGVVLVPTTEIQKMLDAQAAEMQANLPPSVFKVLNLLRTAPSVTVAVKIDAQPAMKLIVQMQSEKHAQQLVADWEAMTPDFIALLKGIPKLPSGTPELKQPPPGLRLLALMPNLKLVQQGSQVAAVVDTKTTAQVVDCTLLARMRVMREVLGENKHPIDQLMALKTWLENYQLMHDSLPDSLDELKAILSESPKEQEAEFKWLMTNPYTDEFPAFRYEKPAMDTEDNQGSRERIAMIEELKDGKPFLQNARVYADGHLEIGAVK